MIVKASCDRRLPTDVASPPFEITGGKNLSQMRSFRGRKTVCPSCAACLSRATPPANSTGHPVS